MSTTTVPGGSRQIRSLTITDADVAVLNKDGAAGTPSMRTLGSGAQQACAGNDSRLSDTRNPGGTAGGDLSGTYPNPVVKQASTTFALPGDISPPQITADQNDYNPTGLSTASVLLLNSDAPRNLTGLAGGADGRLLLVVNNGNNDIIFKDSSASSLAANRFLLPGVHDPINTAGTLAARPAPGNAGNLYFTTDVPFIYRDNGTSWETYGLLEALSPPNDALFSWVNQGGATISTVNGIVRLDVPSAGSTDQYRGRFKAIPATPYTITLGFLPLLLVNNYNMSCLCLRESSTGKLIEFGTEAKQNSNTAYFSTTIYNAGSPTGPWSTRGGPAAYGQNTPIFLRITDDGTNLTFSYGIDPFNFRVHFTDPRTNFLTGGADQYGYMMDPWGTDCSMVVIHLKEN